MRSPVMNNSLPLPVTVSLPGRGLSLSASSLGQYTPIKESRGVSNEELAAIQGYHRRKTGGNAVFRALCISFTGIITIVLFTMSSMVTPVQKLSTNKSENVIEGTEPGKPIGLTHAAYRDDNGKWAVVTTAASPSVVAARASFTDATSHASNFGELHIHTTPDHSGRYSNTERAYAAGILEGFLTHQRIAQAVENLRCEVACDGSVPPLIQKYFEEQDVWAASMVEAKSATDPFWKQVGFVRAQFSGLLEGLSLAVYETGTLEDYSNIEGGPRGSQTIGSLRASQVTLWDLQLINSLGDLFDIKPAVLLERREDFSKVKPEEASKKLMRSGHCTALVKVTDDFSDLFFGHSSWFHYSNMLRIYKHYALDFGDLHHDLVSFSSYPGMISSLDDFYLLHYSRMAVTQTTNGIYNQSIYDEVTPRSLYAWQRVRTANTLARSGSDWAKNFRRYNGGTYNNQYLVLDLKTFAAREALAPGTLWIVEQIPGLVVDGDATSELERGYVPSYNVPYFREIYDKSGYPTLDARRGRRVGSEYQLAPRAKILRRDHGQAQDFEGIKNLMRSNGYKPVDQSGKAATNMGTGVDGLAVEIAETTTVNSNVIEDAEHTLDGRKSSDVGSNEQRADPFAIDPWMAVCSRGDLDPSGQALEGCYDSKVSSAKVALTVGGAWIINGPTTGGWQQNRQQWLPAFNWDNYFTLTRNVTLDTGGELSQSEAINAADKKVVAGSANHIGQPQLFDFSWEYITPRWADFEFLKR